MPPVESITTRVAYAAPMERLPAKCILGLYPGLWAVSPCLESGCTRDVTKCALNQRTTPDPERRFTKPSPAKKSKALLKELNYRCRVCSVTEPRKFYKDLPGICQMHHNQDRKARYKRGKPAKGEYNITRVCKYCGCAFQVTNIVRFLLCERCRAIPAKRRVAL